MWRPKRTVEEYEPCREPVELTKLGIIILFLIMVIFLTFLDIISALEASAIGTVMLATATMYTVAQNQKQSEYIRTQAEEMQKQAESMHEELRFKRRPRISIYEDLTESSPNLVFQNTGRIPIEATVHLAISDVNNTKPNAKILNQNIPYEMLPDNTKVSPGGGRQDNWTERHLFLQESGKPVDSKSYQLRSVLKRKLEHDGKKFKRGDHFWLRVDVEAKPEYNPENTRQINFIFKMNLSPIVDDAKFSPYSFREAQEWAFELSS